MRIVSVELENIRSHEKLRLDLEDIAAAAIVGRNGAGKSTILIAIDWCLYGGGSPDDLLRLGADRGGVTLALRDDKGALWQVARGRERGKKSWLNLLKDPGGDQTCRTIAETQERVNELIGMPGDAFEASVYAPQGMAGMLAMLSAAERKALLGSLLGLDEYEDWRDNAARAERAAQSKADYIEDDLERLDSELLALGDDDERDFDAEVAQTEADVAAAQGALDEAIARDGQREQVRRREALVREMAGLRQRAVDAKEKAQLREDLDAKVKAGQSDRDELARLEEHDRKDRAAVEAWLQECDQRRAAISEAERTVAHWQRYVDAAKEQIERYGESRDAIRANPPKEPDLGTCDHCGQELHTEEAVARVEEAYERAKAAWQEQLDDFTLRWQDGKDRLADCEPKLEEATRALEALPQPGPRPIPTMDLTEPLRAAREAVAELDRTAGMRDSIVVEDTDALKERFDALKAEVEDLPEQVEEGPTPAEVRASLDEGQARLRDLERERERRRQRDAERERLTKTRAEAERMRDEARIDEAAFGVLARAFGKNGIPAMVMDNSVAAIEQAANQTLAALGSSASVRLVTQVAKKDRKGMIDTLEILVDDGTVERPLDSFSGGERYRVHMALRMGLADVLSAGSGTTLDMLLIDEPTDLDAEGVGLLADLLTRTGRQTLLVTHQAELVQAMPQRIVVQRASDALPSEVLVA
jgi:exonuclease SbcC